jgi:hypothetical protein
MPAIVPTPRASVTTKLFDGGEVDVCPGDARAVCRHS